MRYVSGNVPDGFTKPRKAKSGRSSAMMMISIAMDDFVPRGTGGVGMYYDEDRLKTPLIRTEERGKQVFREATWDEALDLYC